MNDPRLYVGQRPRVYAVPERPEDGIIRVQFADVTLALTLVEASWLAGNIQRIMRSIEMTDADRKRLKPGDRVLVTGNDGADAWYIVKSEPWQLANGEWVIGLKGLSFGFPLSWVVRLMEAAPEVAP